jgi:hypothetical protein
MAGKLWTVDGRILTKNHRPLWCPTPPCPELCEGSSSAASSTPTPGSGCTACNISSEILVYLPRGTLEDCRCSATAASGYFMLKSYPYGVEHNSYSCIPMQLPNNPCSWSFCWSDGLCALGIWCSIGTMSGGTWGWGSGIALNAVYTNLTASSLFPQKTWTKSASSCGNLVGVVSLNGQPGVPGICQPLNPPYYVERQAAKNNWGDNATVNFGL